MAQQSAIDKIEKYILSKVQDNIITVCRFTEYTITLCGENTRVITICDKFNIMECLNYIRDKQYKIKWCIDYDYSKRKLEMLEQNVSIRDDASLILRTRNVTPNDVNILEMLSVIQFNNIYIRGIYQEELLELLELLDNVLKSNIYYYDQDAKDYIKYGG